MEVLYTLDLKNGKWKCKINDEKQGWVKYQGSIGIESGIITDKVALLQQLVLNWVVLLEVPDYMDIESAFYGYSVTNVNVGKKQWFFAWNIREG